MKGTTRVGPRGVVRGRTSASDFSAATWYGPSRTVERWLITLEGLVSVGGLAGGSYMASHPLTTMPLEYLDGTWFHTWRWPGIALFFFVGVCPALVVAATLQRRPIAALGHFGVGIGLMAWIALEAAWIVVSPPLQITCGLIGAIITLLAVSERRHQTWRFGNDQ